MKFKMKAGKVLSVLIVDDEPEIVSLVEDLIEEIGVFSFIVTACNGSEALRRCMVQDFDIIITDLNMPKTKGEGFIYNFYKVKKTRKDVQRPVFVVISSFITKSILSELANYKIKHFLVKPFTHSQLSSLVMDILSNNLKAKVESISS